ncbi:MAG: 50S ribosomal protein L19 [Rickettsiales bacterium]|jgi:large subunit ribosomal protein L19|nr:50S ribosomal protein L19 [Rickettsiales bacterium]
MVDLVSEFNSRQVKKICKNFPDYAPGDLVKVSYRIVEGDSSRIQIFEGIVISREKSKTNLNSTFTVRKISHNIGVERKFPLYSPLVEKVEIVKKGSVRRGKLYYLRNLRGKSARIKEKTVIGGGSIDAKNSEPKKV